MTDILIATPVISDAAIITVDSETVAGPKSNLQRIQPTDVWQSSTLTSFIIVDLGAVISFNFIAMLFTNISASGTWMVRTADTLTNVTAAPDYDSGALTFSTASVPRPHGFIYRAGGWSDRFIRIDISDTSNTVATATTVGRLYVSSAYIPTWPRINPSVGFMDVSQRDRTSRGNTIVTQQGVVPTLEFELNVPSEAEFYSNTFQIQALRAASKDVLVILDHTTQNANTQNKIYYGLMNPTMRSTNPEFRQYIQRYELEGLI